MTGSASTLSPAPLGGVPPRHRSASSTIAALLRLTTVFLLLGDTFPRLSAATVSSLATIRGFRVADHYPPDPTRPGFTNRLKALVTGEEVRFPGGGRVPMKGLRIEHFDEQGRKQATLVALECVYDERNKTASSTGRLQVTTVNGTLATVGDGFLWLQTNRVLYLSNRVVTTLRRDLVAARTNRLDPALVDVAVTNVAATNLVLIHADRCVFLEPSNRVTYSDNVRVDDVDWRLGCRVLDVQFTGERRPEGVVAEGDVVAVNRADGSRITARRADYSIRSGDETMTLTGQPVWHGSDGREITASRFELDRRNNLVVAREQVRLELPRDTLAQIGEIGLTNRPAATRPPGEPEPRVVVTAELATVQLPTASRPGRRVHVTTNVVMISAADASRATGDDFTYSDDSGLARLTGRPATWSLRGREIRGQELLIDRSNRTFTARTDAFLRLPLSELPEQPGLSQPAAKQHRTSLLASNAFLELTAGTALFQTNQLVFTERVRGRLIVTNTLLGTLQAGKLTVDLVQGRLIQLHALRDVELEQRPLARPGGFPVRRFLNTDELTLTFNTNQNVQRLLADGRVVATQIESRPGQTISPLRAACAKLTADFHPGSNSVERATAEGGVLITQDDRLVRGAQATYSAATELVELTGQPYAEFAQGRIRDASILLYDRTANRFRGRGHYTIEWQPGRGTNRAAVNLRR